MKSKSKTNHWFKSKKHNQFEKKWFHLLYHQYKWAVKFTLFQISYWIHFLTCFFNLEWWTSHGINSFQGICFYSDLIWFLPFTPNSFEWSIYLHSPLNLKLFTTSGLFIMIFGKPFLDGLVETTTLLGVSSEFIVLSFP